MDMDSMKARNADELRALAPYLIKLDLNALKRAEEFYQAEQHRMLFGLSLSDSEKVRETHANIRSTHQFIQWLENKMRRAQNNTEG